MAKIIFTVDVGLSEYYTVDDLAKDIKLDIDCYSDVLDVTWEIQDGESE